MLAASSQIRTSTRFRSRLSLSARAARASAAWRLPRAALSAASSSCAMPAAAAAAKAWATSSSCASSASSPPASTSSLDSASTSTCGTAWPTRRGRRSAASASSSAPVATTSAAASSPDTIASSWRRASSAASGGSAASGTSSRGAPGGSAAVTSTWPSRSETVRRIAWPTRKKARASLTSVRATDAGASASLAVPSRRDTARIASPAPPKWALVMTALAVGPAGGTHGHPPLYRPNDERT